MMGNPLVAAGTRDRKVTIIRPANSTVNEHNETVPGTPVEKVRMAAVKPAPGTERFRSAELAASAPMHFFFAYEPDLVRVTDSIEHDDGRTYSVVAVEELGRRDGWRVMATARGEPSA